MGKILDAVLVCRFATGTSTKWIVEKNIGGYFSNELLSDKGGELKVYCKDAYYVKAKSGRLPAFVLEGGCKKHISSFFVPDLERFPRFSFGDMKNTKDALVVYRNTDEGVMLVFVARGKKENRTVVYDRLVCGGLRKDVRELLGYDFDFKQ